jgi:hypothetical protein
MTSNFKGNECSPKMILVVVIIDIDVIDIVVCISVVMQTIARRNMRCLVTADKDVNNSRDIARQLLGKRVPSATDTHSKVEVLLDYNIENCVFYVVRAEMLYTLSVEFRS